MEGVGLDPSIAAVRFRASVPSLPAPSVLCKLAFVCVCLFAYTSQIESRGVVSNH